MSENGPSLSLEGDFDVNQGMSWSDRLRFGTLGYALDPFDADGRKNRYIDSVHRVGLRRGFGARRFRRALDFGCGCGRLLDELTAHADEVFGVDRTAPALDVARDARIIPDANLTLWRSGPLPYSDKFFELAISVYVMLTPEILDASMRELRRVCVDDALVLLVEQVSAARGLTIERYSAALLAGGLGVDCAFPIRQAPRSRYLRLATLARWPSTILQFLAKAEIKSLRGRTVDIAGQSYCDYVIACRPLASIR